MSNTSIVLIIILITLGMTIFNILLNKILGIKKEEMKKIRDQAINLRERMRNAQALGDPRLLIEIQRETIQLTNQMMKKQFLPMCLRCFIFIGIFTTLSFVLAEYDSGLLPFPLLIFGSGWFAIYFVFTISLSLLIYGFKRLYKRYIKKETKSQSYLREIMGILSPTSGISLLSDSTQSQPTNQPSSEGVDSWKNRIKNSS